MSVGNTNVKHLPFHKHDIEGLFKFVSSQLITTPDKNSNIRRVSTGRRGFVIFDFPFATFLTVSNKDTKSKYTEHQGLKNR